MTPQETEQFAALRMHVAHLHNALKTTHGRLDEHAKAVAKVVGPAAAAIPIACMTNIEFALAESEPNVKDLLAEADRDAKLVAARADAEEARGELAKVTARLAKIEGAARKVVMLGMGMATEGGSGAEISDEGEAALDALAEALK